MKRPLLFPLVPFYAAGLALRELRLQRGWERVRRLRYAVISVGNLSSGGSGKTPFTIALAHLLSGRGYQVDVLSRGYGRSSKVPLRVDPSGSAEQYGDEPLLISRKASVGVYVASERYDAGKLAEADASSASTPRVHLLDDGFQHRQLARDIDILLISREDWQDHLLPAGNMRENPQAAKRASVFVVPANDPEFESKLRRQGWGGPIWRVRRRMEVPEIDGQVIAFCGIAKPEQFFGGLRAKGIALASCHVFPDHHRYTMRDIETLLAKAESTGSIALLTTEKDELRLGDFLSILSSDLPLKTVGLSLEIEDEQSALAWIVERVSDALHSQ